MPEGEAGAAGPSPGLWYAAALLLIGLDQATKALVLAQFAPGEQVPLTGFFNLVLVFNRGAAFSFLAGAGGWQTPLLAGFSALAATVVAFLLWRMRPGRLLGGGLTLILAGALGNLIDRLRFGEVVDFLDFHALGWHWPAFNVADACITIGAGLLIAESFLPQRGRRHGAGA